MFTRRFASLSLKSRVSFPADRIPVLEELFEPPVLKTSEMEADALNATKGYVPPVLLSHIEASLTSEFDRPILETQWEKYEDPTKSEEQAARLIHHTMAVYSGVARMATPELAKLAKLNEAWIREECDALLEEIRTGDYARWANADALLGPEWSGKLTPTQLQSVKTALVILGKNANMHPKVKQQVADEICKVVSATIQ